jgi:hypothetical protein
MMTSKPLATLPKPQLKKHLCGLLACMGLMLGSFANAGVMFDDLDTSGSSGDAAYATTQLVAKGGANASAAMHDMGWFEMEDSSFGNVSALPEPGAAALLVLGVLASGVLRARKIP